MLAVIIQLFLRCKVIILTTKGGTYAPYALGRITETGEKAENGSGTVFSTIFGVDINGYMNRQAIDNAKYATWLSGDGPRTEVTATYYNHPAFTLAGVTQHHLRNRVASITTEALYDGDAETYNHATHYSYDIHGNVKSLWQESPPMELLDQGQGLKRIDYTYDLISGKVNKVSYQPGQPDSWYHRYLYDADNRLVQAETGPDDVMYDIDARYFYYPHGPLARVEYGDHLVQGVDYAYTLQGWLKGVNSNLLTAENDIGQDGIVPIDTNTYPHRWAGRDVVGFTLGYRAYDYTPIDSAHSQPGIWGDAVRFEAGRYFENDHATPGNLMQHRTNLYNGNITSMVTTVPVQQSITDTTTIFNVAVNGYSYRYDQLNRLREAIAVDNLQTNPANAGYNTWKDEATPATLYTNKFEYDANGNILRQLRADASDTPFDSLTYKYHETGGKRLSNRLYHVNDAVAANAMTDDIDNQGPFEDAPDLINLDNNYSYDPTGNLIRDKQEKIDKIEWTVSGKVSKIIREANSTLADLEFRYDALGNRVMKIVKPDGTSAENGGTDDPTEWTVTHYVRDANGNPMAVYEEKYPSQQLELTLKERYLYGSSRLGMNTDTVDMMVTHNPNFRQRHLGKKMYELNNHLGNVLAVVTDKKIPIQNGTTGNKSHYVADVVSVTDYYPFGAIIHDRTTRLVWLKGANYDNDLQDVSYSSVNASHDPASIAAEGGAYRWGFNGQEKDDEVKGTGNSLDFGDRIYDPRIGRWLSVDRRSADYVPFSPYNFALNNPINLVDADGNVVVDANGHPVTVSITQAKDGTASATYEFAKGTSQAVMDNFSANGARVINTLIQTTTGREQVQKVIDSQDKIHTNVVSSDKGKPVYSGGGLELGGTRAVQQPIIDNEGNPTSQTEQIIKVSIYESSIDQAVKNTKNPELVQDPNSPGNEFESNKLTQDQKVAAVAAHEYEHATNPVDSKLVKERKPLPRTDPQHKAAYGKGTQVAKEFGDKNKKK